MVTQEIQFKLRDKLAQYKLAVRIGSAYLRDRYTRVRYLYLFVSASTLSLKLIITDNYGLIYLVICAVM